MPYAPIMSLGGDWRLGKIEDHTAKPLTRAECEAVAAVLNAAHQDKSAAELRAALQRSPFDLSLCTICGKPVVCIPDGLPICTTCDALEAKKS